MSKNVWVWTEISGDAPHRQSLELFTLARALGTAEAVVLHPAGAGALETIGNHGAAVIHHGDDPRYAEYLTEPQAATLAAMVEAEKPDLILFSSTSDSRDVLARLMGRLGVGVIANATAVEYDGDEIRVTAPWGAETTGTVTLDGSGATPRPVAAQVVRG